MRTRHATYECVQVNPFRMLLFAFLRIMPLLLNVVSVLLLVAYAFMCLGSLFLADSYRPEDNLDPDLQTFGQSALFIFQLLRGADWNDLSSWAVWQEPRTFDHILQKTYGLTKTAIYAVCA